MTEKERQIQQLLVRLSGVLNVSNEEKAFPYHFELAKEEADLLYQALSLLFLCEEGVLGRFK